MRACPFFQALGWLQLCYHPLLCSWYLCASSGVMKERSSLISTGRVISFMGPFTASATVGVLRKALVEIDTHILMCIPISSSTLFLSRYLCIWPTIVNLSWTLANQLSYLPLPSNLFECLPQATSPLTLLQHISAQWENDLVTTAFPGYSRVRPWHSLLIHTTFWVE